MVGKASRYLGHVENVTAVAFLIAATGALFINVILRYFFQAGFAWSEEFIRYSMIWVTFVGASICVREGTHVAMRLVVDGVKNITMRRIYEVGLLMISAVFCLVGMVWGVDQIGFLQRTGQVSSSLEMPMYIPYLAVPVGFSLMTIRLIERIYYTCREVSEKRGGSI
jgi:C4-dicarboxylate transporter DctQ subunit